jgi:hypothetical protein
MSNDVSDAEVLSHFTTFEPPPDGFHPLTATSELLHKHGFPHRPDPKKEPRLSEIWKRTFSRPIKVIRAELAVDRTSPRRNPLRRRRNDAFGLGGEWAGAQVNIADLGFDPRTEPANTVFGRWTVPTVVAPPNSLPQPLTVGFWVGLGGDGNNNSTNVVQAGIQAKVDGNSVEYSAWTEWFPAQPAVTIPNFDVAPGDVVEVLVLCLPPSNHAVAYVYNLRSNHATSVGIDVGLTNDGTSAEWVAEGNGSLLAEFFSANFPGALCGECIGGTKQHEFAVTQGGVVDTIVSSDGITPLAKGGILPAFLGDGVAVFWLSAGP